jgi:hypothetical protein
MQLEGVDKSQIRQMEFENANTARKSLKIAKYSIFFIIFSIGITVWFSWKDYRGDKNWQETQLEYLKENNNSVLQGNDILKDIKNEMQQIHNISSKISKKQKTLKDNLLRSTKKPPL